MIKERILNNSESQKNSPIRKYPTIYRMLTFFVSLNRASRIFLDLIATMTQLLIVEIGKQMLVHTIFIMMADYHILDVSGMFYETINLVLWINCRP